MHAISDCSENGWTLRSVYAAPSDQWDIRVTDLKLSFRKARAEDIPAIVGMLAEDPVGRTREKIGDPLPDAYSKAFACIEADPNNELIVTELDSEIVGVFQITYVPNLTRSASEWR